MGYDVPRFETNMKVLQILVKFKVSIPFPSFEVGERLVFGSSTKKESG